MKILNSKQSVVLGLTLFCACAHPATAQTPSACREVTDRTAVSLVVSCIQGLSIALERANQQTRSLEDQLFRLQNEFDLRSEALVPRGAVVAFDLPGGCPAGWAAFNQANGRTIIGVGVGSGNNQCSPPLTERRYREVGGAEVHVLTVDEMPSHSHFPPSRGNSGPYEVNALQAAGRGHYRGDHQRPTSNTGGNQPHNNMPPYMVLHYCRKD